MEKEAIIYWALAALYENGTLKRNDLATKAAKDVAAHKRNKAFNSMVKSGFIEEHILRAKGTKGGRPATTYTITTRGRDEFRRLSKQVQGNTFHLKKDR